MTLPGDIRKLTPPRSQYDGGGAYRSSEVDHLKFVGEMLREIAAQLAELNSAKR